MGKAARNRARAAIEAAQARAESGDGFFAGGSTTEAPATGIGAPTSGQQVFPDFPYKRRLTKAETEDIRTRAEAFGRLMRDPLLLTGAQGFIPEDIFQLWMVHGVMAGADGGTPYIRGRTLPDEHGALADRTEWLLLKDDTPAARAEDAEREAAAHMRAMETNLRPEVRAAIRRQFIAAANQANDYLADDPDGPARRADSGKDFGAPRLIQFTEEGDA